MQASELRFEEWFSFLVEPHLDVGVSQEGYVLKPVLRTSGDLEIRSHHYPHCTNGKPEDSPLVLAHSSVY
jgi:hypothetical protein